MDALPGKPRQGTVERVEVAMARNAAVVVWFEEWTTLSGGSAGATFQSPWFDMMDFNRIDGQVLAPAISGGVPTAQLVGSSNMDQEDDLGSPVNITEGSPPVALTTSNPPRYVRLSITVPAGETISFWAQGVARNT